MNVLICVLTRGYPYKYGYSDLILRNRALASEVKFDSNFLNIDYKIFHEGNISKDHQTFIAKFSRLKHLYFINIGKEFMSDISFESSYTHETEVSRSFSVGYKSMCRFWTDIFLDYTKEYDYIVRIDEDCIVRALPIEKLIKYMARSEVNYVTPLNFEWDDDRVTIGLLNFARDFSRRHKLFSAEPLNLKVNPFSNMFILNAVHYRNSNLFRCFMSEVRATNGIYSNRWGDHVIWGLVFKILGEDQSKMVRNDIVYVHGSFSQVVNGKLDIRAIIHLVFSKVIKVSLKVFSLR